MRVMLTTMFAIGLSLIASAGRALAQDPQPLVVPVAHGAKASGGCNTCGTGSSGKLHGALFIGRGTEMPIGCSCFAAQRSFAFGSCNQFFSPGKDCHRCGFGRGNCHAPVGGPPYPPVPLCTYSSYLNR